MMLSPPDKSGPDKSARCRRPRLHFAAAFPPPVHGQSIINGNMLRAFQHGFDADIVVDDIGPKNASRSFQYHLSRAGAVARCVFGILKAPAPPTVYNVKESGLGQVYNFAIALAVRARRGRLVLHHHTSAHSRRRERAFAALSAVNARNCRHIVLSEQMRRDLVDLYALAPADVITLPNAAFYQPLPGRVPAPLPRPFRVGIVSNHSRAKGLDLFLDIIEQADKSGLNICGVIAGPIADDELKARVVSLASARPGLLDYRGPLAHAEVVDVIRTLDLFLFPSRYRHEAQPLVLIEALRCSVPVIGSDAGYISELIGDEGGWSFAIASDFCRRAVGQIAALHDDPASAAAARLRAWTRFMTIQADAVKACDAALVTLEDFIRDTGVAEPIPASPKTRPLAARFFDRRSPIRGRPVAAPAKRADETPRTKTADLSRP